MRWRNYVDLINPCWYTYYMGKIIHILYDVIIVTLIKIIGLCMVVSVLIQVASRNLPVIPGVSFMWTEELGRLSFVWLCLLSAAVSYSKGQQIVIDYFYLKMGRIVQILCDFASLFLILGFSYVVTVQGFNLLKIVSIQRSPVMEISILWFYLAIPVGCGLMTIFTVLCLVDRVFLQGKFVNTLPK